MENQNIFDVLKDTYTMPIIDSMTIHSIQEKLPVIMARNKYSVGIYKDVTVIKLIDFDDIFIFNDTKLEIITDIKTLKRRCNNRDFPLCVLASMYSKFFDNLNKRRFD